MARTGTSCVVDAAGWKAKHEGLETAAIAAADVFYTKHAQGCLEKQPTQREVASKQLSHWMAWIIRKDADFWAKYLEMIPNPVDAQAAPLALKRTLGEMYGNNPAPSQVPSQAAAA